MSLSMKGYRVISIDIPCVWNHQEWIQAFEKFLDAIDVHHIHLYGTSHGGFLAQLFAQHRPRRVRALVPSNTFLETSNFSAAMPWAPVVGWTPSFLLKRYVLTGIRDGPHEPFIADSVDFVVAQSIKKNLKRIPRLMMSRRLMMEQEVDDEPKVEEEQEIKKEEQEAKEKRRGLRKNTMVGEENEEIIKEIKDEDVNEEIKEVNEHIKEEEHQVKEEEKQVENGE